MIFDCYNFIPHLLLPSRDNELLVLSCKDEGQ